MSKVAAGTWVQIHRVILESGKRAPQVPPETQAVPLEMRVRGTLAHDAALGDEVEILTAAGRSLRGRLVDAAPRYAHDYGMPVAELVQAGLDLARRRYRKPE